MKLGTVKLVDTQAAPVIFVKEQTYNQTAKEMFLFEIVKILLQIAELKFLYIS